MTPARMPGEYLKPGARRVHDLAVGGRAWISAAEIEVAEDRSVWVRLGAPLLEQVGNTAYVVAIERLPEGLRVTIHQDRQGAPPPAWEPHALYPHFEYAPVIEIVA